MNKFPSDDADDFSDLRKRVDELEALLKNRAPITAASKGWRLGADDPPEPGDLDPGEVHIRSEEGSLVVRSEDGDVTVREFVPAGPVDDATVSLFNPPPEYSQSQIQTYTDSVQSLADSHQDLLDKLRAVGIIAS